MPGDSIRGACYFITFVDDYSCFSIVYLLQKKLETIKCFQEFKNLVENQTTNRIQIFHTNNGRKFTSHAFRKFCIENGILHQYTTTYTTQHNGVAQRKK